ncbi:hypothetical protein BpHYR1_009115 [Brachionus plicatilis]|uniref:Uncharacterized protein n=1 Tax=Brachionus plicatilis TaxID=10195 RepID=A0A3M7SFH4_BRAPC|nr:hypothetical protein BpHYR1_009115 [Brachionus plicatilis]
MFCMVCMERLEFDVKVGIKKLLSITEPIYALVSFFNFQNLLERIFIIFIRSMHRALIKSICELKHKFSSNEINFLNKFASIGWFLEELPDSLNSILGILALRGCGS